MCYGSHPGECHCINDDQKHITDTTKPTLQAVEAIDALLEATPETPSYMIGMQENKISRVPLVEAVTMV